MHGFGSVGGCLGLGLEERETNESKKKLFGSRQLQPCVWINVGKVWTHLLGWGTGRAGVGTPGMGAGPQTAGGPWTTLWPCITEGLRTSRELLGSAGRGFWGGLGFSNSWKQNRRINIVPQYLQQVALTVRQSQLRPAGLLHLSQASGQSCPCSWPWEDLSCGFNL